MGRASKNWHHSKLASGTGNTGKTPSTSKNTGLPMKGVPDPINPPSKSIPTGRKNLKKY